MAPLDALNQSIADLPNRPKIGRDLEHGEKLWLCYLPSLQIRP